MLVKSLHETGRSSVDIVGECTLYSNYLVHTSFLFGNAVSTPLFIALHPCLQHERKKPDMERKYMNSGKAQ